MIEEDKNKIENIVLKNVFYNKPLYIYIFKKVTKIGEAIYSITDLIKDEEPLKWSLRKSVTKPIYKLSLVKDNVSSFKEISGEFLTLKNLLEIAKNHLIISQMNYMVIEKELNDLVFLINKEVTLLSSLPQEFFEVALPEEKSDQKVSLRNTTPNQFLREEYKGHYKRHNTDMSFKTHNVNKESKTNRRQEIINIISSKADLTIKDITSIIKNCSEKTIQRELTALLAEGLIKKTGERRWSRYSLVV